MKNSKQPRSVRVCRGLAVLAAACTATVSQAAWTGDWTNTVYTNTGNWASSTIDDTFSANLGANRTVNLPEAGAVDYATSTNGLVFTYADAFSMTVRPSDATARTVALNGNIVANVAGNTVAGSVNLGVSGIPMNLDLGGAARTFMVTATGPTQWTGFDSLNVVGDISNGTLIKDGWGTLNVYSALSLNTEVDFRRGTLQLNNINGSGTLANISGMQIQSTWARVIVDSNTVSNIRINDAAPVTFRGGAYFQKNALATAYSETLGDVTLASGRPLIAVDSTAVGATTLTLTSLTRQNSAMLVVGGPATLGSTHKILVSNAASSTALVNGLVGGGGTAGTTNVSILPWATREIASSATQSNAIYGVSSFVTYDATSGFRPLNTTTEFAATLAAAGSTDNVRLTANETLAANKTINSLLTSNVVSLTNNAILTVTSGAIGGTPALGAAYGSPVAGTLAFGSNRGYFAGRGNIFANTVITGSDGIAVGGPANMVLYGNNTYTGDTIVHGQLTTAGGGTRIPDASDVRVSSEGILMIGGDNIRRDEVVASLSGRGVVVLGSNAATSSLRLGTSLVAAQGAVSIGSHIAPGDAEGLFEAGTLTFGTPTAAVRAIFETGSSFRLDLASDSQYDQLAIVNGSATINGGTIDISVLGSYVPGEGDVFNVLTAGGGITGTFGLINGDGYTFTQSIVNGNTLQLAVAVPEPVSISTFGLAIGALLLRRNRKA